MKKSIVILTLFISLAINAAAGANADQTAAEKKPAAAELSFSFTRQSGFSTNQFAIWIEDSSGNYIKTLYATHFTAAGGWQKRETSIPTWVKQSGIAGMTKPQIDALSASTPKTGKLEYYWDGSDRNGIDLPPGAYVICLEGTLRQENQVLYRGPIQLGQGPAASELTPQYTGTPPGSERDMISSVTLRTYR